MSTVIKYFYSAPVTKATITTNPIIDKLVLGANKQCNRYTIAAVFNDEDHTIKFGFATCRPGDNFCKAIGRELAAKNAIKSPFHIINDFSGVRNDYADEVMEIMLNKERSLLKREHPHFFDPNHIYG